MNQQRPTPVPFQYDQPDRPILRKSDIAFDTVRGIDHDADLWFQLRGHSYNALVDAATPLLGLSIRIRRMDNDAEVQALYDRVHNQIAAIGEEVRSLGYDNGVLMAYRYCLCSFLDEAVMGTPWGSQSVWAERSLLSAYHNETWGGEKFFTIMSRMLMEPEQYKDMLEFIYICLCLGFKGKYQVQHNGNEELQRIIEKLHRVLRQMRGDAPEQLGEASTNVAPSNYRYDRRLPWWTPWAVGAGVLAAAYFVYAFRLSLVTSEVLQALDKILAP
ncbi:type IVB secretion system protein IcmH/DotU [Pseudoxanthomonas putridarboris]|uniref:Type IVB secretion system protein IcmH/DotU n=1 Tax=Pseudoxanthomonas putridarboris TaxID=752605 RepID=A0ABU9J7M5_9GAMM